MAINDKWNFEMYGTPTPEGDAKAGQTFHEQHLQSGTHGSHATTVDMRTDKK